jgi:hypothetical protein
MNPDTGAIYATPKEAIDAGEDLDNLVYLEGRRDQIDKIIANAQQADKARAEAKRKAAKKHRVAAEAARKKNRRKK